MQRFPLQLTNERGGGAFKKTRTHQSAALMIDRKKEKLLMFGFCPCIPTYSYFVALLCILFYVKLSLIAAAHANCIRFYSLRLFNSLKIVGVCVGLLVCKNS